jgi:hypothetical protein
MYLTILIIFFIFFAILITIAFFINKILNLIDQSGGNDVTHSKYTGYIGEYYVTHKLLQLDIGHYKVLNDVLLPSSGDLNTTQIDHIVVSNYGIFCIETKMYQGWIFGNANQEHWTQVIFQHKERFYNPLRQNYAHIKAIEALIKYKYPKARVYSLIVFPNADKLEISETNSVVFIRDTIPKIESYTNIILSNTEKDEIYEILIGANISDEETRKSHDQGVRDLKSKNHLDRPKPMSTNDIIEGLKL